jgi:hypothetical protein
VLADRVEIPQELAARVMFDSDRTCCVCRLPGKATQIHHIDEDASNNAYENLAVLCFDCHSGAHTKLAFARSLNALQLKLYNESWRDLVRGRLMPNPPGPVAEYAKEVVHLLNKIAFGWVATYSGHFLLIAGDVFENIRSSDFNFNQADYQRSRLLFVDLPKDMDRR